MKLHYGAQTDVGRTREHNEDNYGVAQDPRIEQFGHLFIVCDGIGGYQAGEVASELAVNTILKHYYEQGDQKRADALCESLRVANEVVHQQGRGTMGTTCVAGLFHKNVLLVANVGDSRGYIIRRGRPIQVTHDHSFVAEQVRAGLMTPEQARVSHVKNIITRAIGHQAEVQIDVFEEELQVGDLVLLCSDGLHGLVEDEELARIAQDYPPEEAARRLIDLANARGGSDNITVILVRVDALDAPAGGEEDDLLTSLISTEAAATTQPIEATTEQIPTDRLSDPEAPTARLPVGQTDAPAPAAASAAAQPAPAASTGRPQRRLNKAGLLLSLFLFVLLLGAALYLASPNRLNSGATTPTVTPAATASPTVVPTQTDVPAGTPEGSRPANQSGEETLEPTSASPLGNPTATSTP